jgi:hypothetical protein
MTYLAGMRLFSFLLLSISSISTACASASSDRGPVAAPVVSREAPIANEPVERAPSAPAQPADLWLGELMFACNMQHTCLEVYAGPAYEGVGPMLREQCAPNGGTESEARCPREEVLGMCEATGAVTYLYRAPGARAPAVCASEEGVFHADASFYDAAPDRQRPPCRPRLAPDDEWRALARHESAMLDVRPGEREVRIEDEWHGENVAWDGLERALRSWGAPRVGLGWEVRIVGPAHLRPRTFRAVWASEIAERDRVSACREDESPFPLYQRLYRRR